jgi:hypothetical protein
VRLVLACARAQALTTALGITVVLVLADWFIGARLLALPFLKDAVAAGRVFPALLAGCGALVVASDWGEYESTGSRPVQALVLGRWAVGGALAFAAALAVSANQAVVGLLYVVLGVLATVLPRHWWLALPALLYLQLYLPSDLLPQ